MKKLICLFLLLVAPAWAALAPDTLGGKIYRDAIFARVGPGTNVAERTIVLGQDGRFVFVKNGSGNALYAIAPNKIFIDVPRANGAYTYVRTGDATGTISLLFDDETRENIALEFVSATGGRSDFATRQSSFSLADAQVAAAAPVINVSLRGRVAPGQPLIAGFVVPGTRVADADRLPPAVDAGQREVMIRVVGPSLTQFGLSGVWPDPDFQLFRGATAAPVSEFHYGDWSVTPVASLDPVPGLRKIFSYVGAFPLVAGSKDAVDVVRLPPGDYTVVCNPPAGDLGGEVLIEVYFLP